MFPMKNPILNNTKATVIQYAVLTEPRALKDEKDVTGKKGNASGTNVINDNNIPGINPVIKIIKPSIGLFK